MKKVKLFTLLAALSVCLGASSCALPDILYPTVEGHQHTIVHYYNSYHHWDECTECGERLNVEDHIYGEATITDTEHAYTCTICGYELIEEHIFVYSSLGDEEHSKYCSSCGYSLTENHNIVYIATTGLVYDEDLDEYVEKEGHTSACVCGYGDGEFEEHKTSSGYTADNEEHYLTCDICSSIYQREAHTHEEGVYSSYTNDVYSEDESEYYGYCVVTYSCNVCGKDYTVTYNLDEEDYKEYFGGE